MSDCGTCKYRPYGEQRRYTDCLITEPFWSKRKPKPKNFGAGCGRYQARSTAEGNTPAQPKETGSE